MTQSSSRNQPRSIRKSHARKSHARRGRRRLFEQLETRMLLAADFVEPNDTLGTAFDFGELMGPDVFSRSGLNLENNADSSPSPDFFKFRTVAAGEPADYVRLTHELFEGDLDLLLFNAAGELVGNSESPIDEEEISLEGLPAGVYTIQVIGLQGATNGYELTIQPPRELGPDLFERQGAIDIDQENRTQFLDLAIWDGAGTGAPDEDLFRFTIPEGAEGFSTHHVEFTFSQAVGDLDMELLQGVDLDADPLQFRLLDSSETSTDNERISLENLTSGVYFVRVYGFSENGGVPATGRYDINFDLPTNQALGPDESEPNNASSAATPINASVKGLFRTIDTATDVDFYQVTIPEGAIGSADDVIKIFYAPEFGDLNLELLNEAGEIFGRSEGAGGREQVSLEGLRPGTYFVRVYGEDGATAPYDSDFNVPRLTPLAIDIFDTAAPNNTLATATHIRQDETIPNLSIHSATDVDFYRFTIPAGAVGTADDLVAIAFDHSQGDLDLEILTSTGEIALTSMTDSDNESISLQGFEPRRLCRPCLWSRSRRRRGCAGQLRTAHVLARDSRITP